MSTDKVEAATTYPAIVGQTIHALRKRAGLSQAQMATQMQVTQATWSRIEAGTSGLSIEQLARASEVLGHSPGEILGLAERARDEMQRRGVKVTPQRVSDPWKAGLALIAGAALAVIVMAVVGAALDE